VDRHLQLAGGAALHRRLPAVPRSAGLLAEPVPGPSTDILSAVAKEAGVVVIASLFEKRAQGLYHNTTAVLDADGSYLGKYRKMHIPDDPAFSQSDYNSDCGSQTPLFEQSSESDDCNTGYSHSSHNPISRWTLQFCLNWLPLCNSVPLTCKRNSNPRTCIHQATDATSVLDPAKITKRVAFALDAITHKTFDNSGELSTPIFL